MDAMSSPIPERSDNNEEGKEEDFRRKNVERKRKILRRLGEGVAFGTGKELANDQGFDEHVRNFVRWLAENLGL
jgi:hypothetical protein